MAGPALLGNNRTLDLAKPPQVPDAAGKRPLHLTIPAIPA
ncbi:MAG: hypothetical protein ACI9C2_000975 [Gammaproteobacteria bacterium]|jgi:hypothetical protein